MIKPDTLLAAIRSNTNLTELDDSGGSADPGVVIEVDYLEHEHATSIQFDGHADETGRVIDALDQRASTVDFAPHELSIREIATLLRYSAGINRQGDSPDEHRRTYPSAGARYPLELYVSVLNSRDVPSGKYHYNVKRNELERIQSEGPLSEIAFIGEYGLEDCSLLVFLTGVLDRTCSKYGLRGYRFASIEAGHIMQNCCLVAEELGLVCRPWGGFVEENIRNAFGLPSSEHVLYAGVVGCPSEYR